MVPWDIDTGGEDANFMTLEPGCASTNGDGRNGHISDERAVAAATGWRVPLASPMLLESELAEAISSYRSGWLSMGPRTTELEHSISAYTGATYAVAVSSCTAALHLACTTSDLGPGDTVIVPSLGFAATANVVAYTGATPRFAEIRGVDRPWLAVEAVEEAIEPSTKAVVAMSYGGHPGEIQALAELCERRGIALIEDAAHACGSWHNERHLGTFGIAGALSFSAGKNLGIGEGGMLLTDDEEIARRARSLRWHGISASTWERHQAEAPEYTIDEIGFNYRIDDPRAALAVARLRRLDADNLLRAEIDSAYRKAFESARGFTAVERPPNEERASYCIFAIVLEEGVGRTAFRRRMAERGVQTSIHFPPLHASSAYGEVRSELPLTEKFAARTVSLPIYPHMNRWQRDLVIESALEAGSTSGDESLRTSTAADPG